MTSPRQPDSIVDQRAAKEDKEIQSLINSNRSQEDANYQKRYRANLAAGKGDTWTQVNDPIEIQKYGEQEPANGKFVYDGNSPGSLKEGLYQSDNYPGTIFKVDKNKNFKMIDKPTPEALVNFADAKGMTSITVDAEVPQGQADGWLEELWRRMLASEALYNLERAMQEGQEKGLEVTIGPGLKSLIDKDPKLATKFDSLQKANQAAHKEAKQLYPLQKSVTFDKHAQGLKKLIGNTQTTQEIRANAGNTLDEKMKYLQERISQKKTEQDLINSGCRKLSNDVKDTELVKAEIDDPNSKFKDKVKKIRNTCKSSRDDLTERLKQSQDNVEKELDALETVLSELKKEVTQDPAKLQKMDGLQKQIDNLKAENKSTTIVKLETQGNDLDQLLQITAQTPKSAAQNQQNSQPAAAQNQNPQGSQAPAQDQNQDQDQDQAASPRPGR